MNNTEIRDFFDLLNDEQKKAVLACHTEEEIERVIDQCDIELSLDMLEDVSGGKGAFLPTLLSGIILMSGAASLKTSADEPAVYAAPTGATVSDMMPVEEHDNEIVLTPGEISKYITDMSYFAHSPGFTVSNLFQEMVRKYGRDLTEDLYVRGCKLVLSKKYNVAVEDIDKEYPGLIENARRAVYPFRMNEYAHKQNWENWVDIPDNYFRGIDEGLTQDELDELTAFGKTYIGYTAQV
jgi:hypothetical protein